MTYFVVVAYDIRSTKRRTKVHNLLKDFGYRVQLSVFECEITRKQCSELRGKIRKLINVETDSVRYYLLDKENKARTTIDGCGKIFNQPGLLII